MYEWCMQDEYVPGRNRFCLSPTVVGLVYFLFVRCELCELRL